MNAERPVLVRLEDVHKSFPVKAGRGRRAVLRAVDGVSLVVFAGETLGLVGESGCGKSTLGRCIVRLTEITSGTVEVAGTDISRLGQRRLRPLRRRMQMVFQDPYSSLNPRQRIDSSINLTLRTADKLTKKAVAARVRELLELVGLQPDHAHRFPHEFSGGQRQRVGIARALAAEPDLIVADEPVSALDVSIQAQIINLFVDLQRKLGLTYIFIAHDLSVVRQISDRIAVMYLGRIVEIGPTEDLIERPMHPYTRALLAAVPVPIVTPGPRKPRAPLTGDVPSPVNPPSGCRFHPRCPISTERCRTEEPTLVGRGPSGRAAACHYPLSDE